MREQHDEVMRGSPVGALWSLSWPLVLTNALRIFTLAVMLFWLGRLIGESGLAIESLSRPLALMVPWFLLSIPVGTSALVSRSVGAADGRGLSIAAGALMLSLVTSGLLAAILVPLSSQLADLLVGDLPIAQQMFHFLIGLLLVAFPFNILVDVLLEVSNATGDTKFNVVRMLVDVALMGALMPLLITAGLGIAGGPVAEGIGGLVLALVMCWTLFRRPSPALGRLEPGAWRINWPLWRQILAIGVPVQVGRLSMFVAQLVYVRLVASDGEASVVGYGIAGMMVLLGANANLGLAQGGGILIGQALGSGRPDRARGFVKATLVAGGLVMGLFLGLTLFDRPVIKLFTSDPAMADATEHALSLLRWGLFGVAAWQIMLNCFASYGATVRAALLIIVGEAVGVAVALAWPGSHLDGVCVAFIVAGVVKAGLLLWLFVRRHGTDLPAASREG